MKILCRDFGAYKPESEPQPADKGSRIFLLSSQSDTVTRQSVNTGCNSNRPPALKLSEFVFNLRNFSFFQIWITNWDFVITPRSSYFKLAWLKFALSAAGLYNKHLSFCRKNHRAKLPRGNKADGSYLSSHRGKLPVGEEAVALDTSHGL